MQQTNYISIHHRVPNFRVGSTSGRVRVKTTNPKLITLNYWNNSKSYSVQEIHNNIKYQSRIVFVCRLCTVAPLEGLSSLRARVYIYICISRNKLGHLGSFLSQKSFNSPNPATGFREIRGFCSLLPNDRKRYDLWCSASRFLLCLSCSWNPMCCWRGE